MASTKANIYGGPSKFDLQTALFVRFFLETEPFIKESRPHLVEFRTDRRTFRASITGVETADDSGEEWVIKGDATPVDWLVFCDGRSMPQGTFRFRGSYSTKTRKGSMTLVGYKEVHRRI